MWIYRRLGRVPWTEKRTNQYVLNHLNVTKSLMKDIKSRKLKYFGHVKRHQNIIKSVLEGVTEGRRCRGRQRSVWCDNKKGWTGRSVTACSAAAQNRTEVHSRQPSDWRRHLIGITYWVCTNLISPIEFVRILFIYLFIYLLLPPNFVIHLSQKIVSLSSLNFHSIFGIIRNRAPPLFSVITQPWRHPGAILCFYVIIHIFITIHHKLTKFSTHKFQGLG